MRAITIINHGVPAATCGKSQPARRSSWKHAENAAGRKRRKRAGQPVCAMNQWSPSNTDRTRLKTGPQRSYGAALEQGGSDSTLQQKSAYSHHNLKAYFKMHTFEAFKNNMCYTCSRHHEDYSTTHIPSQLHERMTRTLPHPGHAVPGRRHADPHRGSCPVRQPPPTHPKAAR